MKEIIATLGAEQGATRTAIKKWRQRGFVPPKYRLPILDLAEERGIHFDKSDFEFGKPRKAKAPKRTRRAA
jgi:hypothetical protein